MTTNCLETCGRDELNGRHDPKCPRSTSSREPIATRSAPVFDGAWIEGFARRVKECGEQMLPVIARCVGRELDEMLDNPGAVAQAIVRKIESLRGELEGAERELERTRQELEAYQGHFGMLPPSMLPLGKRPH